MNNLSKRITLMVSALVVVLFIPLVATAYTVVLRSGQRVEIPDRFVVTQAGITYATAPRMEITIQMSVINVTATEAANREPRGALTARIGDVIEPILIEPVKVQRPATVALRTLTNIDLEPYRRARQANEQAFDQLAAARGTPNLAEIRRRQAADDALMADRSLQALRAQGQAESYWRQQAARQLDRQAELDQQIAVVRSQLQATPVASLRVAQVDIDGLAIYSGRNLGTSPVVDTYLRSRLLRDLRRLERQRSGLQVQWNQLEEDARRAGAPASWLRR
ncbi:MAG: hypothetical protein ABIP75_02510 [Pyrinomonadaceae bacterium]